MTGTPIQNSLAEMWTLFDFACQGQLLGSRDSFSRLFEAVITRATDRDATAEDRQLGDSRAQALRQMIEPFFLRRDKASVFKVAPDSSAAETSLLTLQKKTDLILWTTLSAEQQRMYEHFLESDKVQELLNTTRSPLAALTVLKKICDHPHLLKNYTSYQNELQLDDAVPASIDESVEDVQAMLPVLNDISLPSQPLSLDQTVALSGKLQLLCSLMQELHSSAHRCLIFSQSKQMLDIIAQALASYSMLRIDGTVTDPTERQARVDTFNKNQSIFCFLLTTQVV
jgi:DNA excision repair protein ERCC-6-like